MTFTVVLAEAVPRRTHGFISLRLVHTGRGLYVGHLSESVWREVKSVLADELGNGRITLIRDANQGAEVEVLGTSAYRAQDFDGLILFQRVRAGPEGEDEESPDDEIAD